MELLNVLKNLTTVRTDTEPDEHSPETASILIVDDNPHNLQVLGKLLRGNNYEIEFATNGKGALDWLGSREFDIILLDKNMPVMDGFEVCRKIRSNPLLNNVPIIFLSAESERDNILQGFELGAQDYIAKPFDSRELLVRVKTHLGLKRSHEKLDRMNRSLGELVMERTAQLSIANTQLEVLTMKLLELDKAKSEFLNLISHEIRTPLNGIIGVVELIKESVSPKDIAELLDILNISTKRLERFALNALLITRLKTRQFEIDRDKISLTGLIDQSLREVKEQIETSKLRVIRNDQISGCLILGESSLVKKSIDNILENAIVYSPEDSTIEINTYVDNKSVICEFRDNGKGFCQPSTEYLFDLFNTGDSLKDNCTGIGLPVTKMIMDAHGGNIILRNNPDGGASVSLIFHNCIAG